MPQESGNIQELMGKLFRYTFPLPQPFNPPLLLLSPSLLASLSNVRTFLLLLLFLTTFFLILTSIEPETKNACEGFLLMHERSPPLSLSPVCTSPNACCTSFFLPSGNFWQHFYNSVVFLSFPSFSVCMLYRSLTCPNFTMPVLH